jgi:hypothetical protein
MAFKGSSRFQKREQRLSKWALLAGTRALDTIVKSRAGHFVVRFHMTV